MKCEYCGYDISFDGAHHCPNNPMVQLNKRVLEQAQKDLQNYKKLQDEFVLIEINEVGATLNFKELFKAGVQGRFRIKLERCDE